MVPVTDDLWPFPPAPADQSRAGRRASAVRPARSQDLPVVTHDGPPAVVTRDDVPQSGRARFRAERNRSWAARRDVLPAAPADPDTNQDQDQEDRDLGIWIEDEGSDDPFPVLLPTRPVPARHRDILPPSRPPEVTDLFPPRREDPAPWPAPVVGSPRTGGDLGELDDLFPAGRPGPTELDDLFPPLRSDRGDRGEAAPDHPTTDPFGIFALGEEPPRPRPATGPLHARPRPPAARRGWRLPTVTCAAGVLAGLVLGGLGNQQAGAPSAAAEPLPTVTVTARPAGTTTTTPHRVHYANCAAVRAAGAAPLHRGEPGYRSGLDPNGDGVAC